VYQTIYIISRIVRYGTWMDTAHASQYKPRRNQRRQNGHTMKLIKYTSLTKAEKILMAQAAKDVAMICREQGKLERRIARRGN
jgi:hypothetical protein